jgi:hypothetical protein
MSYVLLQCVKEKNKLRVKMISSAPFIKGINCQFPRNIRHEGMYYVVKTEGVIMRGSFYSAMQKNIIVCQTYDMNEIKKYIDTLAITGQIIPGVIFGDDDDDDCIICMDQTKDSVFSPCGHYMTCSKCSIKCKNCPICRANIVSIIKRIDIKD